jgi:putative pyruvate formate lyase activating enzyme
MSQEPGYIALYNSGELEKRIKEIEKLTVACSLCPRHCGADRRHIKGSCHCLLLPVISSAAPHFGEEPPLTGYYGSGTIFFTNCNLNCIYCQNYDISQLHVGREISYESLADLMTGLQERGCHNINLVTPTHQIYSILKALETAIEKGLRIPLVYNSGGYDALKTLELLEGIVDIYMPDFKYFEEKTGKRLSKVDHYPETAMKAIREMYRQVGDLKTDDTGVAFRGLIVRHLVLPGYYRESEKIIDFIASVSGGIYLNLMDQYRPVYRSNDDKNLGDSLSSDEYRKVYSYAASLGLRLE